ncbi:hypothetical protein ABID30_003206 [Enterococcus rotai]|uniref:hypothetical protein n=1 Tax=Enterococcus rotai TaxID=118060 RepID=UPI00339AF5EA
MKKFFYVVLFISLTGCSANTKDNLEDIKNGQSSSSYIADSTLITKENYDSSLTKSSSSIDNTVSFSSNSINSTIEKSSSNSTFYSNEESEKNLTSSTPYAVSPDQIASLNAFNMKQLDGPFAIEIGIKNKDTLEGTITFYSRNRKNPDQIDTSQEDMKIDNIPTKEIRIFSANNSDIRTVRVNTQINLLLSNSSPSSSVSEKKMYLFLNKDGQVSLVTPNHTGNVAEENFDVMIESLQ